MVLELVKRNKPEEIILHCAATPDGHEFGVEDIRRWHLQRGFNDIGYHYVVTLSGTIEVGRTESTIGAHVRGHNTNTIGICFIGTHDFTNNQFKSFYQLYLDLFLRYQIMPDKVKGHYEYDDKKSCPNIDMNQIRKDLWDLISDPAAS